MPEPGCRILEAHVQAWKLMQRKHMATDVESDEVHIERLSRRREHDYLRRQAETCKE